MILDRCREFNEDGNHISSQQVFSKILAVSGITGMSRIDERVLKGFLKKLGNKPAMAILVGILRRMNVMSPRLQVSFREWQHFFNTYDKAIME